MPEVESSNNAVVDASSTQRIVTASGDVTETRHKASFTDIVGIVCLTLFAIVALWRNEVGSAVAVVMVIPGIVGVRSALSSAVRNSNGGPPMAALTLIGGAIIVGLARMAGRSA